MGGGHWTRDLEFTPDGKTLYVSVGSRPNDDDARETRRAWILAFDPDGMNERVFASGIRNPVGLATHPETKRLWTSVNERDGLGDHLVPDYITRVEEGGFYGWPWYYTGANDDPRYKASPSRASPPRSAAPRSATSWIATCARSSRRRTRDCSPACAASSTPCATGLGRAVVERGGIHESRVRSHQA